MLNFLQFHISFTFYTTSEPLWNWDSVQAPMIILYYLKAIYKFRSKALKIVSREQIHKTSKGDRGKKFLYARKNPRQGSM